MLVSDKVSYCCVPYEYAKALLVGLAVVLLVTFNIWYNKFMSLIQHEVRLPEIAELADMEAQLGLSDADWYAGEHENVTSEPIEAWVRVDADPEDDDLVEDPENQRKLAAFFPITDSRWADAAICTSVGGDFFFPPAGGNGLEAKIVCASCPVRMDCMADAMRRDGLYKSHVDVSGVRGGLSAKERISLGKLVLNNETLRAALLITRSYQNNQKLHLTNDARVNR